MEKTFQPDLNPWYEEEDIKYSLKSLSYFSIQAKSWHFRYLTFAFYSMSLIISGRKHDYSTFDLGSLIMTVIKKNIFFVKLNDKFNELTTHDQKLILQKNMSEMCHIRGAIRFDTKSKNFVWYFSKKDQLQMAFEKKKPSSEAGTSSSSSSSSSSKNSRLSNALIGQQDMSKFYKSTTR